MFGQRHRLLQLLHVVHGARSLPSFVAQVLRGQTPRPPDALATAVASAWLFHLRLDEVLKAVEFLLDALNAVYKHVDLILDSMNGIQLLFQMLC